jgi:Flp pilus assembly protein TadD
MSKKSKKTTDSANNQAPQIFGAIDSSVNIQDGINHHYHGRLDLAQKVYLQLLSNNPNNSDALHLLGVIARKAGDLNKSNDLIEKF